MTAPGRTMRASVAAWIGAGIDKRPWITALIVAVASVIATTLLADPSALRVAIVLGVYVCAALVEYCASWWRREEEKTNGNAARDYRLAVKDALGPITRMIVELQRLPASQRADHVRKIAIQAAGACAVQFNDRQQVRSVVFEVVTPERMRPIAYVGRADEPKDFEPGTARGRKAFKVLKIGDPVVEENVDTAPTKWWAGTGKGYKTFITVPIAHADVGYGLLTVDAPQPGTFSDTDRYFIEVVASLLAIAYASCDGVVAPQESALDANVD